MKRVLFLAVPLLVLSACEAEIEQPMPRDPVAEPAVEATVYHAATESGTLPETRIYADENMKVLWNADDRISIYEKNTYNYQYKYLGEDGETAGDFEKVTPEGFHTGSEVDYVYAAYPYRTSNKLSNSGVFTMTLPAEQDYKENSFGIGANTMVAVTDNSFLAFKNVCGYFSFRLYGDDVTVSKVVLQGRNGEKIAGKASVSIPLGGLPSVTMAETATDAITLVCDPAVKIGTSSSDYTSFWFVIPPVTFSGGLTITVYDDKGGVFTKSASKSLTVSRNKLEWMEALKVKPKYATVEFADDDFKAYCLENFDANGDGEITSDEAVNVETIDVCTDEITSLGGVEGFTNLKSLSCTGSEVGTRSADDYNGKLESLDVSGLALLEELDCHGNRLETLDVSSNPELGTLICTDNPMSEIKMAVGQEVPVLECPEDTEIVHEWGDGISPSKFPDENFSDYVFVNFDTDGDGFLSDEECNEVTIIEVNTDNIRSLQGIEFFKNLTNLQCAGTSTYKNGSFEFHGQLSSLDLSANTALQILNCDNNKLTELDVTNNVDLTFLGCHGNQLTSLDISNNIALRELSCGFNQLSALDLSNNTKLNYLSCNTNQLTALDVSKNTSLEILGFNNNLLTGIDLSNNAALITLDCSSNQITSLDVSANTALTNLQCDRNPITDLDVSNNKVLHSLVCRENQLSSLDVSKNYELQVLWCLNNDLTSLDVSNNAALSDLDCRYNPLTTLYVATGQEIAALSKPDTTEIVYLETGPSAYEIWYRTTDGGALTYTVTSDTGNVIDDSLCKAPKDNDGIGVIRFTSPISAIDNNALENQDSLVSLTLPNSIETIGTSAFEYCTNLSEVHLGSSLKTIGAWAFGSTNLGDIDFLPDGLQKIGAGAFQACHPTTVVIPESVEYLGVSTKGNFPMGNPFYDCYEIETFVGKFATEDGKALIETSSDGKTYLISYAVGRVDDSYVVPVVDAISYFAFWGASSLSRIELPSSLETLYDCAFYACRSLKNVTIPSGIQAIGGSAFGACKNLEWVMIESTTVPSPRSPHAYYYGPGNMFPNTGTYDIYVPDSSVSAYQTAEYWSAYADRIKPISSLQ